MRVIHQSQLTEEFDGTLPYDNSEWIEIRTVGTAADAVQDRFTKIALRYIPYLNSLTVEMVWLVTVIVTVMYGIYNAFLLLDGLCITELSSGALSAP